MMMKVLSKPGGGGGGGGVGVLELALTENDGFSEVSHMT